MNILFTHCTKKEHALFRKYNTPEKIQDFLDTLAVNFEEQGDTLQSPRSVLESKKAQCLEGALLGAAMLLYHGFEPILLDLVTSPNDDSHTVALFCDKGLWGALSKTNHAVLRYRDPVYASPRELAMSYFHEYFLDSGHKTLQSYAVFPLVAIKQNWIIDEGDVWYINTALDRAKHISIIPKGKKVHLRKSHPIERAAGKLVIEKKR